MEEQPAEMERLQRTATERLARGVQAAEARAKDAAGLYSCCIQLAHSACKRSVSTLGLIK